jgi:hypothetical protein
MDFKRRKVVRNKMKTLCAKQIMMALCCFLKKKKLYFFIEAKEKHTTINSSADPLAKSISNVIVN